MTLECELYIASGTFLYERIYYSKFSALIVSPAHFNVTIPEFRVQK